jgi:hypothetical protein
LQHQRKRWRLYNLPDLKTRDRILKEFNQSTLDDVGPVAGARGNRFLQEINEMQNLEHDQ